MNKFLRRNIRSLKRQYGTRINYKIFLRLTVDLDSGHKDRVYSSVTVRRAIVFPESLTKDFVYDLAYIASNKNFTQGGYFGRKRSTILIDKKDLTQAPNKKDIITSGITTWRIEEIQDYIEFYAFGVVAVEGEDIES